MLVINVFKNLEMLYSSSGISECYYLWISYSKDCWNEWKFIFISRIN